MTLGVALGSGGARGWCNLGVLKALEADGIQPDVVAGCSMGALVGAAWAGNRLNALEKWGRNLTDTRFLGYVDLRFEMGGLVRGRAIADMLAEIGLPEKIEDLDRPFIAVDTDMASGREIWLQDGSLADAVRASASIPGVFSPHQLNGKWLLDGGLINPVPTSACRALGADVTIAVNPNGKHGDHWSPKQSPFWEQLHSPSLTEQLPKVLRDLIPSAPEPAPNYLDVLSASIDIMTDFLRKARYASDPPHVLLEADLTDQMTVLELYRASEAIGEGERLVAAHLEEIRSAVGTAG